MKKQVICLFVCIAFVGCQKKGEEEDPPAECNSTPARFTAVTFNAGLAPGFVPLATPRIPVVADAVAAIDADIFCLQEVWTKDALSAVSGSLEEAGMEVYTRDTTGVGETGNDKCTAEELRPAVECAVKECSGLPDEEVSDCVVNTCQKEAVIMYLFAPKCLNCIISQPGKTVSEVQSVCVDGPGASRLYGGRNSIVLASRHEMRDKEAVELPSSGANRVALMATVEINGSVPIEVGCLHLSADGVVLPTHPDFSTWDEERQAQLRLVSDRLRERANGRPILLLGDMNFGKANGPAVKEVRPEMWDFSENLGFFSPAADAKPPFCSSCADNTLHEEGDANALIDHVLVRDHGGCLTATSVQRYFDAKVEIIDHDGDPVMSHPSDHYGIGVTFANGM